VRIVRPAVRHRRRGRPRPAPRSARSAGPRAGAGGTGAVRGALPETCANEGVEGSRYGSRS